MAHRHHHDHESRGNSDPHRSAATTDALIGLAFWINLGFVAVESVGGWWTGSLALLADAGHNLSDVLSLALTWATYRLAQKTSNGAYTYGYRRSQVLSTLANAVSLGAIVVFIVHEAIHRLGAPHEIAARGMLLIAAAGFVANLVSCLLLYLRRNENMNIRGAFVHLATDALGSVAAVVAALGIAWRGWTALDPILSIAIAVIMVFSAWGLFRESLSVLMEKAPADFSSARLTEALSKINGVEAVHDLHVWQLDDGKPLASVHVVVSGEGARDHRSILEQCHGVFREKFNVDHATVQIEGKDWPECPTYCR